MKVVPFKKNRYAIVDTNNNIISDASGHGYTSIDIANKEMAYLKPEKEAHNARMYWKAKKKIANFVSNYKREHWKNFNKLHLLNSIEKEYGVVVPEGYLEFLG